MRVLVVDGDFRRSSLAQMLNQQDGPGLADVLSGDAAFEEVIRDTPIPNLKFLPAGNTKDRSAAELLLRYWYCSIFFLDNSAGESVVTTTTHTFLRTTLRSSYRMFPHPA